jgi:hypothetical protein
MRAVAPKFPAVNVGSKGDADAMLALVQGMTSDALQITTGAASAQSEGT